ncbi:MAG: UDP-N-acetylglucosamine--N-acetylmuramyl-(pentapeptide) pyrophosphoryl-undecaprenol N-acetylglucosamine transferase [Chlamydiia bacterium]|nr:UDP-N-acetylglucosamine--N-acetylmuramyl-(pentapeptide) pyrophosphoryl-undecaprenol N-acetylglucosamine transferase [Chlamydiia bacterium]
MKEGLHGEECIAFAVGGTGGHVLPALNIARNLPGEGKRILTGVGICENPFVPQKEFHCFNVIGKNFSSGVFSGVKKIFKGAREAAKILRKQKCTHVVGMGGFHSLPVLIAALYLRIPITLYEPNLVPGKVNKLFSFFSKRTLVLFDQVKDHLYGKVKLLALATRGEMEEGLPSQKLLRREFGLEEDVTTILIFGGSRGAKSINALIDGTLSFTKGTIQVIHLTGPCAGIKEIYERHGIKAFVATFLKDMDRAWKACDFAICRSGAGTIKEALISATPVLMIPYPHAVNDHQDHNAAFMEKVVGAGKKLIQSEITKQRLAEIVSEFCLPGKRAEMIQNIEKYMETRKGERVDALLL